MADLSSALGFLAVENVVEVSAPIPKPFTFAKEDWADWIAHFERYRRATKLDTSDDKVQISTLLLHMGGGRAARMLDEMRRPEETFDSYEHLVRAVDDYFACKTNVVLERARFNLRAQREGEPAEAYINAVCRMARSCAYGELEAELVRDRLVVGIRDRKCSEALQLEENLTLEKAKSIIIHAESIRRVKMQQQQRSPRDSSCGRCGKRPNHPVGSGCPAKDAKCTRCAKKGHYAKCCQSSVAGSASNGGGGKSKEKEAEKTKSEEPQVETKEKAENLMDKEQQQQPERARTPAQKEESFEFI